MKDVKDITVLCIDTGLFLPFARRMAEDCKRVIFYNPDRRRFPSLKQASIGDGFDDIESTLDFWPMLDDVDLVCFPDIGHSGLQMHLEEMGMAVWGSGTGDVIELNRQKFLTLLGEVGLEVPEYTAIKGLEKLANHLSDKEDQYIKVSRWRGDMETTHWRNWDMDRGWLDWMAVNLGPLKDELSFLVFPAIETDLEIGCDSYNILGQWPDLMISGTEIKDQCYFGSVMNHSDMPKPILEVTAGLSEFLKESDYRNQISMEVRVKDDKSFFLDATQRASMPGSASQQLLWRNFPEIVWAGANGELVNPEPTALFSIEAMITTKRTKDCWETVVLPKELEGVVRFSNCCFVDGAYVFPPDGDYDSDDLGWVCSTGNNPQEVLEEAKRICDLLPDGLNANIEKMVEVIKELDSAQEQGMDLSTKPMPEIADVIS